MKSIGLIYTLTFVTLDVFILLNQKIEASALFLIFSSLAILVALGLMLSVNSFVIKFLVILSFSLIGVINVGLEPIPSLLIVALFFHSACLWAELEKFARLERWENHYRISHKMRHNWLSGLCFFAALMTSYVILKDYELYSAFYSLGLLCALLISNLAYMEMNRLHNINVFWLDVSQGLSSSGQYWRSMIIGTAIFIVLGINFSQPLSEKIISMRAFLEKEEKGPSGTNDKPETSQQTRSGFSPGEVTLTSKVNIKLVEKDEFYVRIDDPVVERRLRRRIVYMGAQELVGFNGKSWYPKNSETVWFKDTDDGKAADGFVQVAPPRRGPVKQTIFLIKKEMSAIFALPGLHTVQLPEVYMSSLGVLGVRPSVSMKNRRYSVYSNYHAYNDLLMDRTLSADYAGDEYLDLPSGALSNKIKKLNRSIIDSSMSLLERLAAIKSFLSDNCQYSLKVENKHKLNPLDNFLFSEKKGHCLLFASAFTLMLREAGIPSRLVNGYAGGAFDSKNKLFVMKSSNAHAWTEVYFARYGWVVVDATPEATNIQPVTASVEDFTEREFKQLSQLDSKGNRLSGSSFFINDTNSFILFLCVSLVLISYFWQFLKRIPALTFLSSKGGKEQKFNPKPEFIILFEKLCTTAGVMVSKSKTPKEMLLEFTHTYEVDDSLNELVDYYYSVRFCGEGREESKEKVWQKLLKVKITQFEKSLALAK